jgi:hypothetical protein
MISRQTLNFPRRVVYAKLADVAANQTALVYPVIIHNVDPRVVAKTATAMAKSAATPNPMST